ncbi:MAG TPA: hypothetical protein EYN28_02710 [Flavobacteriales bacterium]|jgi:hypothetical protein|nr:hypothetical protein [Flavobacteriales bacterium]HIO15460.1 hypothetical protein [Flavobacteriales bacterium]HIO59064.1 hypothetical protein [Flavobacteriales bacterium]
MLEFCKSILSKVSFDRTLFAKELKKSVRWLKRSEIQSLKDWCLNRYGGVYGDLIINTFANQALLV